MHTESGLIETSPAYSTPAEGKTVYTDGQTRIEERHYFKYATSELFVAMQHIHAVGMAGGKRTRPSDHSDRSSTFTFNKDIIALNISFAWPTALQIPKDKDVTPHTQSVSIARETQRARRFSPNGISLAKEGRISHLGGI